MEFCLSLEEPVEAIGHFSIDVRVLLLFVQIDLCTVAKVYDVSAREDPYFFSDAIAYLHHAGATSCHKGERCVGVEEGMGALFAHRIDSLEKHRKFILKVP